MPELRRELERAVLRTYVLAGLQEHVRKLISISQLDAMLNVVPTLNEAVDLIFMSEVEKQLHKEE